MDYLSVKITKLKLIQRVLFIMDVIQIKTNSKNQLVDITAQIQSLITKNNIQNGTLHIFCPHTTAGLTINENADPSVKSDIIMGLNSLDFEKLPFKHMEGNSPSHIKAGLMGFSQFVIINNGNLVLGTWQGIYFCEFDGPRNRKIYINKI